jgi:hypothetical protein
MTYNTACARLAQSSYQGCNFAYSVILLAFSVLDGHAGVRRFFPRNNSSFDHVPHVRQTLSTTLLPKRACNGYMGSHRGYRVVAAAAPTSLLCTCCLLSQLNPANLLAVVRGSCTSI